MPVRFLQKESILVLILQAILCFVAFNKFFVHPSEVVFMNTFDGIKNYFTFQSYLQQDASVGMALVQGHAYPFGDYLFYADLTPTIAVPLRFFCIYVYDISEYGIPIFNFIIILLHWLSALLSYKIITYFVKTPWIAVVLALAFTWINPQLFRLGNGHFNLSIALFILLTLLLLIQIYKAYSKNPTTYFSANKGKSIALLATLYFASFTHLYFLPTLGITIGFFAFFFAIDLKWRQRQTWINSLKPLVILGTISLLGFILVMGTIRLIDSYYALRAVGNGAYGFADWKMTISSLFSAREFNFLQYLFSYSGNTHYESNLYLGAFILYSLTGLLLLKLFGKSLYLSSKTTLTEAPLLRPFLGVAFLCFFIALGDRYYFMDNQYYFKNYFNPFFYLRKFVSQIEQFRCLARFFWPAFWVFSFAIAYWVDYYYRKHSTQWIRVLCGILVLLAVSDAKDSVKEMNNTHRDNYFHKEWTDTPYKELATLDFSKYQAVMPLPYFHSSSEITGLVIDGNSYYNREIQRVSLLSRLPMMSIQSSRTPVEHTKNLFSIFTSSVPDSALLERLNEKPILVLYHKEFHEQLQNYNGFDIPIQSPAKEVVINGQLLPAYYHMRKINEDDIHIFYEWLPKKTGSNEIQEKSYTWDMETSIQTAFPPATDSTAKTASNYWLPSAKNVLNSQQAQSGKKSIIIVPNTSGIQQELHNVIPGSTIKMSVWRHTSNKVGAFVVEGENFYKVEETIIQEEGNWQQIQATIFIPINYKGNSLQLRYWNATNQTVYLDDYSIKISNRE